MVRGADGLVLEVTVSCAEPVEAAETEPGELVLAALAPEMSQVYDEL